MEYDRQTGKPQVKIPVYFPPTIHSRLNESKITMLTSLCMREHTPSWLGRKMKGLRKRKHNAKKRQKRRRPVTGVGNTANWCRNSSSFLL